MVKLKTICRSEKEYTRETKMDIHKVQKNINPTLHLFQKPREYQRALTATKIEKIFAKPFLGVLAGHSDGISVMAKSSTSLTNFISGSYDGELRFWDLSQRKTTFRINAHENVVKGLTFSALGANFLSCGDDKMINLYSIENCLKNVDKPEPINKYISKSVLNSIDHSWKVNNLFATSGEIVQVWNYERSLPVQTFEWGADSVTRVRFNPSEANILASIANDRSFVFYDIRAGTPLKKTILNNKSSSLCWNPMEPFVITLANDDSNCYTFDMRKLESARMIHKDHIQAVMDIDYAPTGKEFVSGSWDKTVRLFPVEEGKSREVFHTKRMQKIYTVAYSMDNEFVLCGSQEFNIRLWKTQAAKPLGTMSERHQRSYNMREKLKDKFKYNKEIRKISKHRQLPKYIHNAKLKQHIKRDSAYRKMKNQKINNPARGDLKEVLNSAQVAKKQINFYNQQNKLQIKEPEHYKDAIFTKLCPKENFVRDDICHCCGNSIGFINNLIRRNCHFCGLTVCEEHSKKKRGDPQDRKEFVRICDTCENKYLTKMIYDDFNKSASEFDVQTELLDANLSKIMEDIRNKEAILSNLVSDKQLKDEELTDRALHTSTEIGNLQREINSFDKDIAKRDQEIAETQKNCEKILENTRILEEQLKITGGENDELSDMLLAVAEDIKDMEYMINELEKEITEREMRKLRKKKNEKPNNESIIQNKVKEQFSSSLQSSVLSLTDRSESESTTKASLPNDKTNQTKPELYQKPKGPCKNPDCQVPSCKYKTKRYEGGPHVKMNRRERVFSDQIILKKENGNCEKCRIF